MIQKAIEEMICPTHGQHPIVERTEDGLSIRTCCEDFRQTAIEKYKELKAEELRQALLKGFQK